MNPFPPALAKALGNLDDYGNIVLRRGYHQDAIQIQRWRYDVVRAVEDLISKRLHKGSPLHMIGICYLIAEPEQALQYFAAAYVEDVLSEGYDGAKLFAAYRVLTKGYLIPEVDVQAFANTIQNVKLAVPDPFAVTKEHEMKIGKPLRDLSPGHPRLVFPKRRIEEIQGIQPDDSKRVFVGGSFDNILWLKLVENAVLELDYYAVMSVNFEQPQGMTTDDFTKKLLSLCKYAVFDISVVGSAGHYVEISHAKLLGIKSLGVYQSMTGSEHRFTEEIEWLPKSAYASFDVLKVVLRKELLN